MKPETLNEEMLRRYLLDDVSDEEQREIEERFFEDDSFFDEMNALEDELFFDYKQNRLNAKENAAFEQKFLNTPQDREKAAFAEAFLQSTEELAEEKATVPRKIVEDSPASWRQSIAAFFSFSNPALQFGFAAASVLLLLGMVGLFVQNSRLRDEMAGLQNNQAEERQEQEQIIAEKQQQFTELERRLADEKLQTGQNEQRIQEIEARRTRLEQEIAEMRRRVKQPSPSPVSQPPKSPVSQPQRSVVALVLSPGLFTRSGGEGMSRVKLSSSVKNLQLRLLLKGEENYKGYRATLKTVDEGNEVWTSSELKARGKGAKKSISLNIPAKILQRADYELSLVGITANGETEEITGYYFSVLK